MKVLITGGAGFIGSNLSEYFLKKRSTVTVLDNFSTKGSILNAQYLSTNYPRVGIVKTDVRNFRSTAYYVKKHEVIFHLAGQVAVTKSIENPREDFESNVVGTLNVLEAARRAGHRPIIIDSSTNKVYGQIKGSIRVKVNRYIDLSHKEGISEEEPLDFYSPYGCSKGASDQYVRDYARIFGLPTIVFRQSCIYGPHQFGIEDQGWVAHFAIRALFNKPITIYGTGFQVRDLLYIDDLIDAYEKAIERIDRVRGEIFNIGGGPSQTTSLLEVVDLLPRFIGRTVRVTFDSKRPGDQDVYVSDVGKARRLLGWRPTVPVSKGLGRMIAWMQQNSESIKDFL